MPVYIRLKSKTFVFAKPNGFSLVSGSVKYLLETNSIHMKKSKFKTLLYICIASAYFYYFSYNNMFNSVSLVSALSDVINGILR